MTTVGDMLYQMGGVPVSAEFTTGSVFFVDSTTGSNSNDGKSPDTALATIDAAIGRCTADKGDIIYAMPKHVETISAANGIALDVAGVSVIGMGRGLRRPVVTFDTAAAATFAISGASCMVKNIALSANFADITSPVIVSGKDCILENVSFVETATSMNFLSCIATSAVANAADGLSVIRCERISVDAAALAFISILAHQDRVKIIGNYDSQLSAADVGHFIIMGAFNLTNAKIVGNICVNAGDNNAQAVGDFMTGSSTASSGVVAYNLMGSLDTTTELFDTATLEFHHFENYHTGTVAKSGTILPAIET